jgi:hypothetical protein
VFATFRAVATAAAAASISAVQPAMSGQPGTPVADSAAALVRDQYGNPVPGVTVSWAVTSGGGSVSPASSTTNAQGIARARWTLGGSVVTPQTLRASAGASMNATFTGTAAVGAGATLTAVSGGGQTAPVFTEFGEPLVVEVRQNGVAVEGAQVQWTTSSGTFSDVPTVTTTTDAQGRASVRWKPGSQAGAQTATATLLDASVSFAGTVTAGTPNRVVPVTGIPGNVPPGTVSEQQWRVTDGYGNPVAGVGIQFTTTYGTAAPASATTDAGGYASTTWTFPTTLGTGSSTATLRGFVAVSGASASVQTDVRPVPTKIVILGGESFTLAVGQETEGNAILEDQYGNQIGLRGYQGCGVVWSAPAGVELHPLFGIPYPRVLIRGVTAGTYTITATCGSFVDTIVATVQ